MSSEAVIAELDLAAKDGFGSCVIFLHQYKKYNRYQIETRKH